jgi:hypothetical protein
MNLKEIEREAVDWIRQVRVLWMTLVNLQQTTVSHKKAGNWHINASAPRK